MSKQTGVDQYLPWSPKAINEDKAESWKDLLQDALSNSDSQNTWKVIQGLNGSPVSMSHEGRSITDIKSKNSEFINKYARVSRLSMSRAHQVNNSRNVSTHHMLSSWSWQHSAFISQVTWSFGLPRITIHIQLILFTCSLRTHLVGCHNHSITKTWKISK